MNARPVRVRVIGDGVASPMNISRKELIYDILYWGRGYYWGRGCTL